jgi:hypothetical protein
MQTLKRTLFAVGIVFFFHSCSKNSCLNSEEGVLKNYTGLDGCGWVIVLEDGTKLEPTNLTEFDLLLEEGKKISIRYEQISDAASICMVGEIIKIKCIKER